MWNDSLLCFPVITGHSKSKSQLIAGIYCDIDDVSYATTSKVHVTSDVSVATQRLRIPKQLNCWNPQQRWHGEWNPATRCLLSGAPTPYFRGSRIKTEDRDKERREKQKTDPRRDQHRLQNTRSQEIQGPEQRNQARSETQRQRVRVHCKQRL
jgi:hypothetical protein